ncbi:MULTISPECIES: hypothetical protein [unclassified Pseudoalteromonas]|uniref:hypothetical protein n=1 Tax=unclassified Pseudoalteromonas TaxID=194690 RepID=UPI00110C140B|nr:MULTISPECIES: hypothetical protein [unclassified Pseudoalteromonas]MDC9496656.1 hypothetical protein [Pseudoalteromonas sp. Angola-20]MDC9516287.1 hypothetical protein [Pseudoalteromonas sp. Angola-22]MDC9532695.1 hypothetical protein [Pseudoalteromonas sp. Angola-9]TMP80843.1 hypothetical protein CWB71_13120 [Pseudoalteromonas sp. S983]
MTTNNMKYDASISADNFDYLDRAVSQVHSLTVFITANDNYKSMTETTLANLLWTVSERIGGVLTDSVDMYFGEIPREQLKFEQLLIQAKTVLDALRNSEGFGGLLGDHLSNVIWLVDGLLEDAIKELGKMSTRSDEQVA